MPSATIDVINLALMEHPVIDSLLVNQRLVCPSLQAETTLAGHISGRSTVYWRHIQLRRPGTVSKPLISFVEKKDFRWRKRATVGKSEYKFRWSGETRQ